MVAEIQAYNWLRQYENIMLKLYKTIKSILVGLVGRNCTCRYHLLPGIFSRLLFVIIVVVESYCFDLNACL